MVVGLILFMFLLALVGCGAPFRFVVLQHPVTKQTVHCQATNPDVIDRKTPIKTCMRAYKSLGFEVVADEE